MLEPVHGRKIAKKKKTAEIRDWHVVRVPQGHILCGDFLSHHKLPIAPDEENFAYTSLLLKIDFVNKIAETQNTIYKLVGD